jgi:cbb3-type cytochrome oxidase maturation protein
MAVTWVLIIFALVMGLGSLCFYLWAASGGHFKDLEDVKYQVFHSTGDPGPPDEEESPADEEKEADE